MNNENITNVAPAATYTHKTINYSEFQAYVKDLPGLATETDTYYSHIEYLSSPHGVIVLAHCDDFDGTIEGIHPASLSASIDTLNNTIQPLADENDNVFTRKPIAYNQHWMTRRSQGSLVLAAFGRMIDGGDEEAPCFLPAGDSTLLMNIYDTPRGPVCFIFHSGEEGGDTVYVIQPEEDADFIEDGATPTPEPEFIDMTADDEVSIRGES